MFVSNKTKHVCKRDGGNVSSSVVLSVHKDSAKGYAETYSYCDQSPDKCLLSVMIFHEIREKTRRFGRDSCTCMYAWIN